LTVVKEIGPNDFDEKQHNLWHLKK